MRHQIGFFILRSVINPDTVRGKTFCAYPHQLYSTRGLAEHALKKLRRLGETDSRFTYEVQEAWHVEEET